MFAMFLLFFFLYKCPTVDIIKSLEFQDYNGRYVGVWKHLILTLLSPLHFCEPAECHADCASCFSENFCTRCHPGHFLLRGKCETSCPNGLAANAALRECIGKPACPTIHVMEIVLSSFFYIILHFYLSVSECPAGCELCTRKNACTRCRANMYLHQGQCHHTCPKGFEPNMQLMECVAQSEKKTYFSDIYSSISTSAFLSLLYGFSSSLSGWRMDKLGSLCSEKGQVGPQEGRGNPHQTSPPLPKYLW